MTTERSSGLIRSDLLTLHTVARMPGSSMRAIAAEVTRRGGPLYPQVRRLLVELAEPDPDQRYGRRVEPLLHLEAAELMGHVRPSYLTDAGRREHAELRALAALALGFAA